MQMRSFLFRPMTSIHLLYDITGSITKCHIDSLILKLVFQWFLNVSSVILMFSLKFMNMQIR